MKKESMTSSASTNSYEDNLEDFFQVVENRRSIRKYKNVEIPDDDISRMIDAARMAPSTNNSQPWQFIIVKEPETIKLLSAIAGGQSFIADAKAVVMALANGGSSCCPGNPSMWHVQDTMIATEHIVLAATALGYGSCWVAMLDSRDTENVTLTKSALRIPDDVDIVALVTLGVSDEVPSPRSTKDIHHIAFSEVYGKSLNS